MRVVIHGLTKTFVSGPKGEKKVRALGGVDLEVKDREFFGVIGPTGCGKTTLLHILAGLEKPTDGTVEFVGEKRTEAMVSMVFQDAALMPWRTVANNVPLGPEFRKQPVPIYRRVTQFFLEMVRMVDFSGTNPLELSGGMKQKVAIARALANDPEVIVMDEPFANLDAQTRLLLREELISIWEKHKKTVILVTHNLEEAVMLCDRVAVMSASPGVIKSVVPIDVKRPRGIKSMSDPDFIRCMEKIWELLRNEVDRAMRENHPSKAEQPPAPKKKHDWWW
ncbi:MAG TPA: ABC transporter ATP-binding protein [Candidatus Binatia bacterium]|jgi:NitT/TauT family transport system ATP-binding protein